MSVYKGVGYVHVSGSVTKRCKPLDQMGRTWLFRPSSVPL